MFGIEINRFKKNVAGEFVYRIPIIGLIYHKAKESNPAAFTNASKPHSEKNGCCYIDVPINSKDEAASTRAASFILHSCGDSRFIYN